MTQSQNDYFDYLNGFTPEELLRQLQHWHPVRRSKAAGLLGELGNASEPVIQALLKKLDDKREDVTLRSRAAVALGKLGNTSEPVIQALLQRFDDTDEDKNVRYSAACALVKLSKTNNSILPLIIQSSKQYQQWIEQHQDSDDVGDAIDALW